MINYSSRGHDVARKVSTSSTNSTLIKGAEGALFMVHAVNVNASPVFLKIYNKATAPTVGTDTPVMTVAIPGSGSILLNLENGIYFSLGIGIGITGAVGDSDTTNVTAGEQTINIAYC